MLKWVTRSFKIYTKEEIITPFFGRSYKNLIEMVDENKAKGIGMKVWRKTWPENSYFIVTRVNYKNMRVGDAWGMLTWKGVKEEKPRKIRGALKLGTWQYSEDTQNEPSVNS
jgi:hypothetical protein